MTYEGLRLRINRIKRKVFAKKRNKLLKNTDFTIISNNCWGGMIYDSYNLPKLSPTVGLFFMAKDYIKFVSNLKCYLEMSLEFIDFSESKYRDSEFFKDIQIDYPIGRLGDVELFFMHYHSKEEALEKWNRRKKRVNYDNLIVKFNDSNLCTEEELTLFDRLPIQKKCCFTVKEYPALKSVIKIKVPKSHKSIKASYEPFGKNPYIDLEKMING